MKIIIDCADENKLYEVADEHGLRPFNEFMMFWFKKVNLEAFLKGISYLLQKCRYRSIYDLEIKAKEIT